MFIIPCKYNSHCKIEETVEAVRNLYPNEKILVVDSDSEDLSYFEKLKKHNVIIAEIKNNNYESGALWYAVENYVSDWYVVLQDSVILKKNIDEYLHSDELFYCFINFIENSMNNHMRTDTQQYISRINEMLGDFEKLPTATNTLFCGVFGPNFIIKRKMIDMMLQKNLNNTLRPLNKYDHQITERVYGLIATQCGINMFKNTLSGNLHELFNVCFDSATEIMNAEHISKTWVNKHRQ